MLAPFDPSWRRIGILGGAFDPPHAGHTSLARMARDELALEAVVFIPAARPPHKGDSYAPFSLRLAMVEAAVAGIGGFHVSGLEAGRPGPSYSVDTLRVLREQYGADTRLFFLVGYDAFLDIHLWKEYELIPELAELVVASRAGFAISPAQAVAAAFPAYLQDEGGVWRGGDGGAIRFLDAVPPDISSTRVRQMVAGGEDVSAVLAPAVADIIAAGSLYRRG